MENNEFNLDNVYQEINQIEYKNKRKSAYNLVLATALLYLFLTSTLAIIMKYIFFVLNIQISDAGYINLIITTLPLIIVYLIIGKKHKNKIFEEKEKLPISKYIFFYGLAYILTLVFSIIAKSIVNIIGLPPTDVTSFISNNITISLMIYALIIGPIIEEIQYRGFYLNHLREYGPRVTIFLTALVFSFSHMNILQSIGTLGIALVFSYIAYFYSIKASIILHIINNVMAVLLNLLMNFAKSNENSIENTISGLVTIIFLILIVYTLIAFFKKENFQKFKYNLGNKEKYKGNVKALLKTPMFIVYIIIIFIFTRI